MIRGCSDALVSEFMATTVRSCPEFDRNHLRFDHVMTSRRKFVPSPPSRPECDKLFAGLVPLVPNQRANATFVRHAALDA